MTNNEAPNLKFSLLLALGDRLDHLVGSSCLANVGLSSHRVQQLVTFP